MGIPRALTRSRAPLSILRGPPEVGSFHLSDAYRNDGINPFDKDAVPDILKLEATATCFAISVKRYALYIINHEGQIVFLDDHPPAENGLGHFLIPEDPGSDHKEWIKDVWRVIIGRALGREVDIPHWFNRPTMVRTTVSSTPVLQAFRHLNADTSYAEQVKPFNFMLSAVGAKPPAGVKIGSPFRLVAPYETDARKWEEMTWVDVHDPEAGPYRISTRDGRPGAARVDTFEDVVAKYESHPEAKALGPDGDPCGRMTVGLSSRRPVTVGRIVLIGKEANRLEARTSGELSVNDLDERLRIYPDDDVWRRIVLPVLQKLDAKKVAEIAGVSPRRARDWLKGRAVPHSRTMNAFVVFLRSSSTSERT